MLAIKLRDVEDLNCPFHASAATDYFSRLHQVAANAAFGLNASNALDPAFDAYADDALFYHAAFIFEDVGVTAYSGALPLINSSAVLSAAAGIMAVEAYHAGAIRTKLFKLRDQFVFPYATTVNDIVGAISNLRAALSGPANPAEEPLTVNGSFIIAPADSNGIAFARTVAQVMSIVTAGSDCNKGLFFPAGLNGVIQ